MLPVLYKFSFDTLLDQVLSVLAALAVVAYAAYAGWRGAHSPADPKTGEFGPPARQDQLRRAGLFGAIGVGLAGVGLWYVLPASMGAKGEGIPIHTYGLLLVGGFLGGVVVAGALVTQEWRGEQGERMRERVMDLALWLLAAGLVGSRVLFILVNWKQYQANPQDIFSLGGGLVFQGGLLAAMLVAWFFTRRHKIDFLRLGDIGLPVVSLGAAFGRLGCFSAGCCWGDVAKEGYALAVHFPGARLTQNLFGQLSGFASNAAQSQGSNPSWVIPSTGEVLGYKVEGAVQMSRWVAEHGHTLGVYPTQIFDSVGNFTLFAALMVMRRYRRFHGQIVALWLMGYAVLRSTVELFRGDAERGTLHGLLNSLELSGLAQQVPLAAWYNISTGQFISLCMFAFGAGLLWTRGRKARMADASARQGPAQAA